MMAKSGIFARISVEAHRASPAPGAAKAWYVIHSMAHSGFLEAWMFGRAFESFRETRNAPSGCYEHTALPAGVRGPGGLLGIGATSGASRRRGLGCTTQGHGNDLPAKCGLLPLAD